MNSSFPVKFALCGVLLLSLLFPAASMAQSVLTEEEQKAVATVLANAEKTQTTIPDKKQSQKETDSASTSPSSSSSSSLSVPEEKLATIDITGVDSELKKNIELHMPVTIPTCNADRAEVKQFFNAVKKHLRRASRALGYYDAEFISGGKIVNGCWKLRLRITPGQPTHVVSQTIKVIGDGKDEPIFKKLLTKLPYKKGDVLNHQKYTDFKTLLSEAAQSLGYFDAEFVQHSIKVNPLARQASINLVLDTKTRYRYGKITVEQDVLSDKTIKQFISLKTGQPYDTEAILKQQQFLQNSGYFKVVKINVLHDQAKNNQIPIKITLIRQKRNNYKLKLGYGSDTGARVSAEMKRRWTGSRGKQLGVKAQWAQNLSGVSISLTEPQKNAEDDVIAYNLDWKVDKNDDVISRSINLGAKYQRKNKHDWLQTASINLLLDHSTDKGQDGNKTRYLLFGVGLGKVKADNLIFPTKGWRVQYDLRTATKGLISDQNILQFEGAAKYIRPLGKGRLLTRAQLGATLVDSVIDLPKSLRFFSGGGATVRGYTFESLRPVNTQGSRTVYGGKQLLNLSLEYEHPITEEWGAAVFVDTGNAFNDWNDLGLKTGVGIGARWKSPIGPVRVDLAFPVGDYKDPHLHLGIGADL